MAEIPFSKKVANGFYVVGSRLPEGLTTEMFWSMLAKGELIAKPRMTLAEALGKAGFDVRDPEISARMDAVKAALSKPRPPLTSGEREHLTQTAFGRLIVAEGNLKRSQVATRVAAGERITINPTSSRPADVAARLRRIRTYRKLSRRIA